MDSSATVVILVGLAANLVAVVTGFATLIRRIEDSGKWRGTVETMLDSHAKRLERHGGLLGEHDRWIARHEGASVPTARAQRMEG